jgi:sugar transferase EpsL|tara:strand:+ start:2059 stop:2466 length:408 start_codon:yes stop_codon:yes gene_type:complete
MENGLGTDKERLTKFGQILRSTSIDELPEIYNVIRGDMSLVGPRPLLMEYLNLYTDHQRLRNNVRPGITGWAQVNGRNAISWEEKFEFDIWYVKNQSVTLYFKIIVLTIKKVMLQRDINTKDNTTMPIFTGTKKK